MRHTPEKQNRHRRAIGAAALLCAALLASCAASTYERMLPESQITGLAERAQAFYDTPDSLLLAPTHAAGRDNNRDWLRVAVHRLGPRDAVSDASPRRVIVFLHGVLADSRTWRYVAGDLAADHRLWLIDLPGVGASDHVAPSHLPPDAYSPAWLSERVAQALEYAIAHAAPHGTPLTLTLVGHSLGGAAILRLLSDPHIRTAHADMLRCIDGAVLLAPIDANLSIINPAVQAAARLNSFDILLASLTGVGRDRIAHGVLSNTADPARAPRESVDLMRDILVDPAVRRPAQAMLLRAIPNSKGDPDWPTIDKITANYPAISKPLLILWGRRDGTLPVAMGYKLAATLPKASLRIFPKGKHSLQVDYPGVIAQLLRGFVHDPSSLRPALDPAQTRNADVVNAPRLQRPPDVVNTDASDAKSATGAAGSHQSARRSPRVDPPHH